ncbi:MAG: carbon-nitrogen hydrolase family protein [Coriobacteriales bacterium]|jgi:predicted amidohydrolase
MDDKTWERMKAILDAEAMGRDPKRVVSKRTLFGIPSHVEEVIAKTVAENEEKIRAKNGKRGDGAPSTFKLALAQCVHPDDHDPVAQVERFASQAAEEGASILAFPESLMTPYSKERDEFLEDAQPIDGPFAQAIDDIARRHGLWLVYTLNERNDEDERRPFNTAVITDDKGVKRGVYRKTHLFDAEAEHESDRMQAGDELLAPIEAPFATIAVAICYDLRFPEVARKAALQGCQLMIFPASWVDGPGKARQWRTLISARAIENEMFVAGLSRADETRIGRSCVADPWGNIIAEGGTGEELITCDIDLSKIDEARANMPIFQHRRPELY